MQNILTPLRYPGGKSKALNKITPFLPKSFREYREPFLGGGSLFLNIKQKFPEMICNLNDLNYDLFCFWTTLQNNPNDFISEIIKIKNNEKNGKILYYKYKNSLNDDTFYRGIRYYILNRISFSGTVDSGGYSQEAFEKRFTSSKIFQLYEISKLLKNVNITSNDYTESIKNADNDVFVYLDPPYLSAVKSKLYGKNGDLHSSFNHFEFSQKMKDYNFKWLITLDDTQEIRKMFEYAFINPLDIIYGMDNVNGKKPKKGRELIITNYDYKSMNNINIYKNIINQFIKYKYNKARIIIDLPLKMVKMKLIEIINNKDQYNNIIIYIKNKQLIIERKNKIKNLTLEMVL